MSTTPRFPEDVGGLRLGEVIALVVVSGDDGGRGAPRRVRGQGPGPQAPRRRPKRRARAWVRVCRQSAARGVSTALLSAVSAPGKPTLNAEHKAYRRAEALNEFFGAKGGPFARRDDIRTSLDALSKALELETMTLAYYQALREVLGHSDALEALIAAETCHVEDVTRALGAAGKRQAAKA